MRYRHDPDLEFLSQMKSEDMNDLVHCLAYDRDGSARFTEELTSRQRYQQLYPDHQKYWDLIAAEIQSYGANTFATILRNGVGVPYKTVLFDVCDKLKVNYNRNASAEQIEGNLLMKILTVALESMTPEQLNELARATGVANVNQLSGEVTVAAFQAAFRMGGFLSYQLAVITVNAVAKVLLGRGLTLAGNMALTKAVAVFTGPIGWAITGAWTAIDVAGTAYRVTIPAVIQVAVLRRKHLYGGQAARGAGAA